jgi:hypothetical protein
MASLMSKPEDRQAMTRHSLPVFLLTLLVGALPAAPRAGAQDLPAAATAEEQAPAAKGNGGRIAVTRSDGSTGLTKVPDKKEIRKLVNYIRDGMKRADGADKPRQTKRATQDRRRK